MSNSTTTEKRNVNNEVQNKDRKIDRNLESVEYTYKTEYGLFGSQLMIRGDEDFQLASITEVRQDILKQRTVHEYIKPWGENRLIACKEGVFEWDWVEEDYVFVGKIIKTRRIKKIVIMQNKSMHDVLGRVFHLETGEVYNLIGGHYTEQKLIIIEGKESDERIVCENDNQVFHIKVRDRAIIEETR